MHSPFETSWQMGPSPATESALEQALATLMTGDFQDRWEMVRRLPTLGERAVGPLLALLGDESLDWEVRWFTARILAAFDRPEVITGLMALFEAATDPELRQSAADALSQLGPSAVMALTQALQRPQQKRMAAQALAQIHHRSTVVPLLALAEDESADLRALAIEALAGYRDERVLPILHRALEDGSAAVRLQAVRALGSFRNGLSEEALVGLLRPRLQDEVEAVCQAAIAILGRLASPQAAQLLNERLQSPATSPALRIAAIQALGWMDHELALKALLEAWPEAAAAEQLAIVAALTHQGAEPRRRLAASALLSWLQQQRLGGVPVPGSAALAQQCALALGQLGSLEAVATLEALQHDPDEGVQLHAIAALRQLSALNA